MNILAGVFPADSGEVEFNEKKIRKMTIQQSEKLGIAFVHQELNLFNDLKVYENIFLMKEYKKKPGILDKKRMIRETQQLFTELGVEIEPEEKVENLKTSQKQLLEISKALFFQAKLLILDEPTAGLDPAGRDEILDLVARMHRERNMTVILVSHSMEDVAKYVERIIVMNHGQVMFDDTPKEVFRHYKELETIGLAAPQVTYLMHELKEHGLSVDTEATTVEEARASLMQALTGIDSGRSDIHR